MLYAGVAWTAEGFEVVVLDDAGRGPVLQDRFDGGSVALLAHRLAELGEPVCAVVDSTNGLVDGTLVASGVEVRRADPRHLGQRPVFGSVSARDLAQLGRLRRSELSAPGLETGTLVGREADARAAEGASAGILERLLAEQRCAEHGSRSLAQVALTFDDGPNPPFTGQVLDVLARYGVPATFFCVGLAAAAHPGVVARTVDEGHDLGNHTWSHPFLPDLTLEQLAQQVDRTDEVLAGHTGHAPALVRPPYGSRTASALTALADRGTTTVLWDVDSGDWALPGEATIRGRVLAGASSGSVVLLHDGNGDRSQTVAALPGIIEGLLDRGYELVPAARALGAPTPPPAP